MKPLVLMVCLLATASTGCSWFRAKPATPAAHTAGSADPADSAVAATPAADPDANPSANSSVTAPAAATEPAQGPVAVAMDFLAMHERFGRKGLPSRADLPAYDAFLCRPLAEALRAAQVRQELARVERPDQSPPWSTGDLFSSLADGPTEAAAVDSRVEASRAEVVVEMSAGDRRWRDTLHFDDDEGIWCLSDVEYGGRFPSAASGRLSDALAR